MRTNQRAGFQLMKLKPQSISGTVSFLKEFLIMLLAFPLLTNGQITSNNHITHLEWKNFADAPDTWIKLSTPIVHNESNMFEIHILGYQYYNESDVIDIRCVGYAYSATTLINYKCDCNGTNIPVEIGTEVRSEQGGNTVVVIRLGAPSFSWYFPQLTAEYIGWKTKLATDFKWIIGETTPASSNNMNKVYIDDRAGTVTASSFIGNASSLTNLNSLDAADGSPVDAVFVDNVGNVGIGTNAPNSLMDIRKVITSDVINKLAYFGYSGSMNRSIAIQQIATATAAKQYIFLNGELGSLSTTATPTLSTAYEYPIGLEYKTNLFSIVYSPTSGAINAAIQNGFCFQPSSGRVGIGVTNPAQRLDVNGTVRADGYPGLQLAHSNAQIRFWGESGEKWAIGSTGGVGDDFIFYDMTAGVARMIINPTNGNVGIGTSVSGQKLSVNGTIGVGVDEIPIQETNFGYSATYKVLRFGLNQANRSLALNVDPLGITGSNFSGSGQILIGSNGILAPDNAGTNWMGVLRATGGKVYLGGSLSSGDLVGDGLVVSNGNVGIGTINPTQKLTVNGKILAEEVEVIADVLPDYVFKEDYKLMSLAELDKFIKANKHLPEVPSEKEVCDNGSKIGLGEMNIILLKKIEELTLYTIEQDETIKSLLKRVTELEK